MLCVQHHQALIPDRNLSLLLNVLNWYTLLGTWGIAVQSRPVLLSVDFISVVLQSLYM